MKNKSLVVVLDTNIYISGIFWKGLPHKILEFARKGKYIVFATQEIFTEIKDKLINKLNASPGDADFIITGLKSYIRLINVKEKVSVIKDDPDDDKFLGCAVFVNADYIISGDHHLLDLVEYQGIKIVKARKFLEEIGSI